MPTVSDQQSMKSDRKDDTQTTVRRDALKALTKTQHQAIAMAEPRNKGKVVGSLL